MKRTIILAVLLLLSITAVSATRSDTIELLTVTSSENGTVEEGGTATMTLQISPGQGNVFIDSFPLTQLDTQISTRFAKEVACDFTNKDCDDVNFYYTIRASSSVVGGPSAGAAAAILTSGVLENRTVSDDAVITGTVNSGGYIGPVGGVKPKAAAAKKAGFDTVVIPKYSRLDNGTVITDSHRNDFSGVNIRTVTTLAEAYEVFTGKTTQRSTNITVSDEYNRVMRGVATDLCQRNDELLSKLDNVSFANETYNATMDAKQNAQEAISKENYYSAASYCFGANIDLREALLADRTQDEKDLIRQGVIDEAESFLDTVKDKDIETMSDVEASIIVKERLYEILNERKRSQQSTAYLVERLDSARAWASFFNYSSRRVSLDEDYLQQACLSKLREAEERVRYLEFVVPSMQRYQETLDETRKRYRNSDYTYCLFKAAKLKADANSILTGRSITEEYRPEYVSDKLDIAKQQIAEQKDFFPILGYSYYQYAKSLRTEEPSLAAVFTEYASEFGALDMYFPTTDREKVLFPDDARPVTCPAPRSEKQTKFLRYLILCTGIFIGILLVGIAHIIRLKLQADE